MNKVEKIHKLFKLLEYTFNRIQFPLEKLRREEKANIKLNSDTFEDPADKADAENERLKDSPVHPEDSGVEGGMNYN